MTIDEVKKDNYLYAFALGFVAGFAEAKAGQIDKKMMSQIDAYALGYKRGVEKQQEV